MISLVKKSLLVLSLSGPFFASASMVDLMYLPEYGKFQIDLGYSFNKLSYSNRSTSSRINKFEQNNSNSIINSRISYSPFNEVQIGLGFDYLLSSSAEQKFTDGTATNKIERAGFKEPYFFTQFRMIKEQDFGFDIDGVFTLAPSFSLAEEEDASREGSAKIGGSIYSGSLLVGKRMDDFAFRANLDIDFYGKQELENIQTGLKTYEYDSRIDFAVGASVQLRFSELHAIEAGIEYKTIGDKKETVVLSNIEVKEDSSSIIILSAGYKGEFIDGMLMGYIDFEFHKVGDYNITTGNNVTENIDSNESLLNAGLIFKF